MAGRLRSARHRRGTADSRTARTPRRRVPIDGARRSLLIVRFSGNPDLHLEHARGAGAGRESSEVRAEDVLAVASLSPESNVGGKAQGIAGYENVDAATTVDAIDLVFRFRGDGDVVG